MSLVRWHLQLVRDLADPYYCLRLPLYLAMVAALVMGATK